MKTLLCKILIVVICATIIQIGIGVLHYPPELKKIMISDCCANNNVYLGDSTIGTYSINDTDKRSISSFLEDTLKQKVIPITHGAYHLGLYRDIVEYIIHHNKPKVVIIPINMRSFSPEWDLNPIWQFRKESDLLKLGIIWSPFYKPFSIYTDYYNESGGKPAWLESDVYDYDVLAGKVKDYENDSYKKIDMASIKRKIIFHYRYKLGSKHRKLIALNDICVLAKQNNLKILFYIVPIDIAYIDSVYKGTSALIDQNIDTVKGVIAANGLSVIDMSHSVPSEYFDWKVNGYPNEHMNQKGRMFVASALFNVLNKQDRF